jgi:magnesium transporter
MARFFKNRSATQGKTPGEVVFIGRQKVAQSAIRIIQFNEQMVEEYEVSSLEAAGKLLRDDAVTWVDVTGLHDTDLIGKAEKVFSLHPLTLEDVVNTGQRPKIEEFDSYLSVMVKMMRWETSDNAIHSEQLSLVWGSQYLLTFQERPGDVFTPVRERLRNGKGRIRRSGPDYLAYALLDTVVDNYLMLIERLGEQIEAVEPEITENSSPEILNQINTHRRELHFLRSSIRPAREAIRELGRLESDLITQSTFIFLRDLNDLATQAVETMDTYHDMLKDQLESHNAAAGNRLNEIMKFLTVFSAIFIPLSLLAGIYGTNFEIIPELQYRYAYPLFWLLLVLVAAGMIFLFKRKKWL